MSTNSLPKLTLDQRNELIVHKAMLRQERAEMRRELEAAQRGVETLRQRYFPIFQEVFAHKLLFKLLKDTEAQHADWSQSAQKSMELYDKRIESQLTDFRKCVADSPGALLSERGQELRQGVLDSARKRLSSKKQMEKYARGASEEKAVGEQFSKKIYKSSKDAEIAQRKIDKLEKIVSKKAAEIDDVDARIQEISRQLRAG